ncbi:MAG TPA: hypothetical protein VMN35_00315 [Gaiellaceae bacterium]|nr:hypothetical protein [Gaiellaceae bacterium]
MRKRLTWLLVTLGIAAVVRKLRRRAAHAEMPTGTPEGALGDPADELRRKLAVSRSDETEASGAPEEPVEERRAEVHAEGRATLDEMRSSSDD